MRHRGFTLIELLVVIAIVTILASILFPVFGRAREKARQVSCASNMHQLAAAWDMYSQDCDEWLVYTIYPADVTYPNGTTGAYVTWGHLLYPYVRSVGVYSCPTNRRKWNGGVHPFGGISINPIATYMVSSVPPWPCSLGDFEDPSSTLLLVDTGTGSIGDEPDGYLALWKSLPPNFVTVAPRHHGRCNVAFMDGHGKALTPDRITGDQPYDPITGHPSWVPRKS
jgi:prepilin-type N-terminal cleavage/methylation domain-containing protein/prepilin-type processing-associated H-X9-DG protein